jgi:TRAP-type mannitol/chloroaromatic compound transport system permease small subunit
MLSERAKLIYDTIINIVIILVPMIMFAWAGAVFAADAWMSGEKLSTTNWFFPAGPAKSLIPIGFFLLTLQCLAEIFRNIRQLKKGEHP